jgi:hypothetical protein
LQLLQKLVFDGVVCYSSIINHLAYLAL